MKSKLFIVMSLVLTFSFTTPIESLAQSKSLMKASRSLVEKIMKSNGNKPMGARVSAYKLKKTAKDELTKLLESKGTSYATAIKGNFYSVTDDYGRPLTIFIGENTTNIPLYIKVYATNVRGGYSPVSSGLLGAGDNFYFGPSQGWIWLSNYGNKMIIEYSNGESVYWAY
jgi:hypothetical protein